MRVEISSLPEVQDGRPCLAGTRLPIGALFSFFAAGHSDDAVAREYPGLSFEGVQVARLIYIDALAAQEKTDE